METVVVLVLGLGVVAQLPVAALIDLDAKRLGLERPATDSLGVTVPMAGFAVILVYVSRQSELPGADP